MTPLELQLEGFTVYREHTVIDWQGAETALFAVTGPTGAGKSTLLDAITYVLYGKTARLGGKGLGGLISPGAESLFAQLTFRTARGVHRATRVAQRKAAGVGTEVRIEVADAQASGGWRQLAESERVKDANQALEEIVGLDYDGFTRAVLLPQGAFDEFLRGDAGLRRQLLSSLLGLNKVESIQRLASTRAAELKGESEARRTLLATEYGDVAPEAIQQLEAEVADLAAFVESEAGFLAELEERLAGWRETSRLLTERADLSRRRHRLKDTAEDLNRVRQRAEAGRRAAGVTPYVQRHEQAEVRAGRVASEAEKRTTELATAQQLLENVTAETEKARALSEELTARLSAEMASLQELAPHHDALTARGGSLAMADDARESQLLDPEAWTAWSTAAPLITPFERALIAHGRATLELERRGSEVHNLEGAVTAGAEQLEARVEAGKRLRDAAEEAKNAHEAARRADLAATLREGLAPGDPCPVCGSAISEHAPGAHGAELQVTADALDAATAALQAAREEYESARDALTRHETNLANARERLTAARTDLSAATTTLNETVEDLERLGVKPEPVHAASEVAAQGIYPADAGKQLRTELEQWQRAALAAHAAAVVERLQAAGLGVAQGQTFPTLLNERSQRLEAERTTLQDLDKRSDAAAREVELARTRLAAASENVELYSKDLAEAETDLAQAVASAGFENRAAVTAAVLEPAELQAMEAEVRAYDQDVAQAERRDVELAAALASRPPVPGAHGTLEEQVDEAERLTAGTQEELLERKGALDEKRQRLGAERGQLEQARAKLTRSVELRRELAELDKRHALHHQLNTDLHGHRFPEHLLTQVQQVLARRASSILQLVTDGRYDLRLEAGDYLVADAWAGGELRSARTLSGGESFVASLALALALSDTLAGSTALGALFLDEGFGTLDRSTLEAVTGVLESLTHEGRMVGVITHVPELSGRLPARLVVTKGPGGSTVAWDT